MTVEELLRAAEDLAPDEQVRLLEELTRLIIVQSQPTGPATALRVFGHDLWDDTDSQEYIDQERDSWGG